MRHQAVKFSQLQRVLRRHVLFEPLFGASVELELAVHPARVVRTFRRISLSDKSGVSGSHRGVNISFVLLAVIVFFVKMNFGALAIW